MPERRMTCEEIGTLLLSSSFTKHINYCLRSCDYK